MMQAPAAAGFRRSASRRPVRCAVAVASAAPAGRRTLYEVLGLRAGATGGEIKAAYRRLARELHPDVAGAAGDDFIRLHDAYATRALRPRRSETPEMQALPVKALSPDGPRRKIVVRVSRIWEAKKRDTGNVYELPFVAVDYEGTVMEGNIPAVNIAQFKDVLKEGTIYTIQGFMLKPARDRYKTVDHQHRITITQYTKVQEALPEPHGMPLVAHCLQPLSVLEKRARSTIVLSGMEMNQTRYNFMNYQAQGHNRLKQLFMLCPSKKEMMFRYRINVSAKDITPTEENEEIVGCFTFFGEEGKTLTGYDEKLVIGTAEGRPNYLPPAVANIVGRKFLTARATQEIYAQKNIPFRASAVELIGTPAPLLPAASNTDSLPAPAKVQSPSAAKETPGPSEGNIDSIATPPRDAMETLDSDAEEVSAHILIPSTHYST
ncbi:hypothetical protein ACQ4PT_048748 [Festuca glaucescens]